MNGNGLIRAGLEYTNGNYLVRPGLSEGLFVRIASQITRFPQDMIDYLYAMYQEVVLRAIFTRRAENLSYLVNRPIRDTYEVFGTSMKDQRRKMYLDGGTWARYGPGL